MKVSLTIFLLLILTNTLAQRVRFSPRESGFPEYANYDIIGHVSGHYLILIQGTEKKEIGVYDENMNKIRSAPADYLKPDLLQVNFLPYRDHIDLLYQYGVDTTFFVSRLRLDGDGNVTEGPTIMDSIVLPPKKILVEGRMIDRINSFRPMFVVQRSENKEWIMILKGGEPGGKAQQIQITLYNKDLRPVEHGSYTYSEDQDPGEFSQFILSNEGDLAFIHSIVEDEDAKKVIHANLLFKPKGADTLYSTQLSMPDVIMDHFELQSDNLNRRCILNSLYYDWHEPNITGLCTFIWDDRSRSLISKTLTPVPVGIRSDARSDFSPPEQILNKFYLRQILPFSNGNFMVLAELCHGPDKLDPYDLNRFDFIHGKSPSLLTPSYSVIFYEPREKFGLWGIQGRERISNPNDLARNKRTDNLLMFLMDRDGHTVDIKVIRKAQYAAPRMQTLSYQTFIDERAIHLLYNQDVKGRLLPLVISIKPDGAVTPEQPLRSLDREQILFPRYGKQVGPKTAIIPCEDNGSLCFVKVEFE